MERNSKDQRMCQFFFFSNRNEGMFSLNRVLFIFWMQIPHSLLYLQGIFFFAIKRKWEWSAAAAVGHFEDRCGCEWLAKQSWAKLNFSNYTIFQPTHICLIWPVMSAVFFYMTLLKFSTAIGILRSCGVIGIQYVAWVRNSVVKFLFSNLRPTQNIFFAQRICHRNLKFIGNFLRILSCRLS